MKTDIEQALASTFFRNREEDSVILHMMRRCFNMR